MIVRAGRKGQSTAEYAVLIGLVVAAALAMQTYVKRGIQGRFHDASKTFNTVTTDADRWAGINDAVTPDRLTQYEPEELSRQSTDIAEVDYEMFNMTRGGKATKAVTRLNKQAQGDYQQYDYLKKKEENIISPGDNSNTP